MGNGSGFSGLPALHEAAGDPDRWSKPAAMTQGNWDMVGRLCVAVSDLRARWGEQQARIEAQQRRILKLQNQVEELRTLISRRDTGAPRKDRSHGDQTPGSI